MIAEYYVSNFDGYTHTPNFDTSINKQFFLDDYAATIPFML